MALWVDDDTVPPIQVLLLLAVFIATAAALYLSPAVWKPLAIRRLKGRCVVSRALVLTYDDGPGPIVTSELLELLAEFDAKATFFLSGQRIEPHRAAAESLVAEGHEVASHGFHHLHAWKRAPAAVYRDVYRGGQAVDAVIQAAPRLALETAMGSQPAGFRPPHGKLVLPTWLQAKLLGRRIDWWTDDSGDSFPELPSESPALALLDRGGGVVLLHDLDRSAPRNQFVIETTRALLEGAKDRGLRVMTLAELHSV